MVPPFELWSFASPVTGALTLAFLTLCFIALAFGAGRISAFGEVWSFASPTCGGTTPGLMLPVALVIRGAGCLTAPAEVWSLASPVTGGAFCALAEKAPSNTAAAETPISDLRMFDVAHVFLSDQE